MPVSEGSLDRLRRAPRALAGRAKRALQRHGVLSAGAASIEAQQFHDACSRLGLVSALSNDPASFAPFLTWRPPGHFYSAIPRLTDVEAEAARIFDRTVDELPGIDLRAPEQLELFARLAATLRDWDFPDDKRADRRYFSGEGNFAYGIGDGMILHAMLRTFRPSRLVELGSGFSSCMTLDTRDHFLDGELDVTLVEPEPELLYRLVGRDHGATVIEARTQDVPTSLFESLAPGDVLFCDTTHVAKVGSDVVDLFARVLPAVAPGVLIHVHDIFWPFEYPEEWVREGRAWTELYVLRAFLQFNRDFEILLWSSWLSIKHAAVIERELPRMLENSGGALWLRRVQPVQPVQPA